MSFLRKFFTKTNNKQKNSSNIEEKIEQVKNDIKAILDEENDITLGTESSEQDLEPTNLKKRAKLKIVKFQEDFRSSEEDNCCTYSEKASKQSKSTKRQGFISFDDFKVKKDTKTFKQQIKNLNTFIDDDDDEQDGSYSSSSDFDMSGSDFSESDDQESHSSLKQLRNKFSDAIQNSESDPFSDFSSDEDQDEDQNEKAKNKLTKPQNNEKDSEDDEFSDF
ncbi:hypothetical protein M0813_26248 [Anaeramoeba flamelloides]|uniref:Uncharacterized protein n=1 Tax=Anaeramoeba flamelloides TaxID=1746091 RepID=A0ABQ8Y155_9EUKA|nr:hypothetical protein M0813_26248 [Anaeramoeba flamelloides]